MNVIIDILTITITISTITIIPLVCNDDRDDKKAAIPCVTDGKDLLFVQKLLALVEKAGIPAPSPVEQVRGRRVRARARVRVRVRG